MLRRTPTPVSSGSTPRTVADGCGGGRGAPGACARSTGPGGARPPFRVHPVPAADPRVGVARDLLRVADVLPAQDLTAGAGPCRRLCVRLALGDLQGRVQPLS